MKRISTICLLFSIFAVSAQAGLYDNLAVWAAHDSDNYVQMVGDLNKARSAHEVSLALRENARRQRRTMDELIRFVRAHPDIRDSAALGLDKEGQQIWQQQHQTRLPPEVVAIQQQMTRRMDAVDAKGGKQMINVLRKYHDDAEVMNASKELTQTMAENNRRLLQALR
jgi:hypothetical protein